MRDPSLGVIALLGLCCCDKVGSKESHLDTADGDTTETADSIEKKADDTIKDTRGEDDTNSGADTDCETKGFIEADTTIKDPIISAALTVGDITGDGVSDLAGGGNNDTPGLIIPGPIPKGEYDADSLEMYTIALDNADPESYGGLGRPGDVNGDGVDDLMFGALLYLGPLVVDNTYSGASLHFVRIIGQPVANTRNEGDVNGDGLADILLGGYSQYEGGGGAAFVVDNASISERGLYDLNESAAIIRGEDGDFHSGDWLGLHVAHLGDVDGDGFGDILVDYQYESWYAMFHGPLGGEISRADADANIMGGHASYPWVYPYGGTDNNGDGFDDLIMTTSWCMLVYWGPIGEGEIDYAGAGVYFGSGDDRGIVDAAPLGDIDGDGLEDVVVTSYEETSAGPSMEAPLAWLLYGPLEGSLTAADADREIKICSPSIAGSTDIFTTKGEDLDGGGVPDLVISQDIYRFANNYTFLISGEGL